MAKFNVLVLGCTSRRPAEGDSGSSAIGRIRSRAVADGFGTSKAPIFLFWRGIFVSWELVDDSVMGFQALIMSVRMTIVP